MSKDLVQHTGIRLASNKMNLSNQEETHQFKFLVVLSIVVKEAPHAVITGIFTGAISARRLAWFWRNGQIIDGVLRLPRLDDSNKENRVGNSLQHYNHLYDHPKNDLLEELVAKVFHNRVR